MGEQNFVSEQKPVQVSWLKRDVLLFANSIGCNNDELHFLYELHPSFAVFPTYSVVLPIKQTFQELTDFYALIATTRSKIPGVPDLDNQRMVDGERHMTFYKPLPTTSVNRRFELRTKVTGVYDKGKPGTAVESQTDLVDAETSEIYTRALGTAFYVGQGGWGGPAGPKAPSFAPPKDRAPDVEHEQLISREAALLYRLNGDYNPLHATPEPGAKMGFGGAIMHGLFSWNATAHTVLRMLGGSNPENMKEFAARFASPVRPGDTLVTKIWVVGEGDQEGFKDVRFVTEVKGGKVCLSNGRAKVRVVGGKGKSSRL